MIFSWNLNVKFSLNRLVTIICHHSIDCMESSSRPIKMSIPAAAVLRVIFSPSRRADSTMTISTLALSTIDTFEASANFRAAKKNSHDKAPATPERIMKLMSLVVNRVSWCPFPIIRTKETMKSIITMARAAVATVESTLSNPIFAKIATRAAKKAERAARRNHSISNHLTLRIEFFL